MPHWSPSRWKKSATSSMRRSLTDLDRRVLSYATGARDHGDEEAIGADVGVDHRSDLRDEEWLGVLDLSSALDQLRVLAGRYGQLGSAARWAPGTLQRS